MVKREVRWNADYDMKRKLVNVRDVCGLITADTAPWSSVDEFEQARDLLEAWKQSQQRVLKTAQDYEDMIAWGAMRANRRRIGCRSHNKLSPVAAAVLKILAWRDTPMSEWFRAETYAWKAKWMSGICGVRITENDVKNARRRGAKPEELKGSVTELSDEDRRFIVTWFRFGSIVPDVFDIVESLCRPGSAAEAELDDLFLDSRPERDIDAEQDAEPVS